MRGAALRNGAERFEHRGMRVSEQVRPRTEQVVDVLVAADVPDVAAMGLADTEVELRVEGEAARLRRKEPLCFGNQRALFVRALDHAALLSRVSSTLGYCSMYSA